MPGRRHIRDERGQTMVELALVLPILCLLLFGVIQFGIIFNNYVTLTDAVRAGARRAAVSRHLGATDATAATRLAVKDAASDLDTTYFDSHPPDVSSTWEHGEPVTVCADYPWDFQLPVVGGASGTLHTCTKERVE
jgi:Flp pilus assembly protein TadG